MKISYVFILIGLLTFLFAKRKDLKQIRTEWSSYLPSCLILFLLYPSTFSRQYLFLINEIVFIKFIMMKFEKNAEGEIQSINTLK